MAARCAALALAWCACAAAPAAPPSPPAPVSPSASPSTHPPPLRTCDTLLLRNPPPMPPHVREHEAAVAQTARALAELVETGAADEARAAALARAAARAPLQPPPAAVALGAPQLHLGVLYRADPPPPRLFIFQQNNSVALQLFWRSLASAWNASAVIWSNAWFSCEEDGGSWWSGAAAARGAGGVRAAAAIFRRLPAVPCEETMYDWLGGPPPCDPATTECRAVPVFGSSERRLEYECECRAGHWRAGGERVRGAALGAGLSCVSCTQAGAECEAQALRAALLPANLAGMLLCFIFILLNNCSKRSEYYKYSFMIARHLKGGRSQEANILARFVKIYILVKIYLSIFADTYQIPTTSLLSRVLVVVFVMYVFHATQLSVL